MCYGKLCRGIEPKVRLRRNAISGTISALGSRVAEAIASKIGSRGSGGSGSHVGLGRKFSHSFLNTGCRSFGQRFAMAGLASGGYRCAIDVVVSDENFGDVHREMHSVPELWEPPR